MLRISPPRAVYVNVKVSIPTPIYRGCKDGRLRKGNVAIVPLTNLYHPYTEGGEYELDQRAIEEAKLPPRIGSVVILHL
jgi:hypothetical protein